MRTEFVYSVIALGAIPVMANAADVNVKATQINAEVLQSANGKLDLGKIALAPGKYALKGLLTSKVYDVNVKINGVATKIDASPTATELNVAIDLSKKTGITEVEISLESTYPTESGADFSLGAPFVNLTFDFAGVVTTLTGKSSALATKINGYAYKDAFESLGKKYAAKQEDVNSLGKINLKIGNIKTNEEASYEDYLNFKLYAEKSTIQEEIEALDTKTAAAEAAYQNEQAYARVNALITPIKSKYNTAITELEQTLVGVAAYLLSDAKKDLNDNINVKITEATQASYASYQAGTAVADEATNKAKIPTEDALNTLKTKYTGETGLATQAKTNIDAYNALHKKVTDFQTRLNNVKPKSDAISAAWPKTEAENAINALNTKIENAKNSAAQLTLNVTTEETAAETKLSTLEGKVATANAEFDANKATTEAIGALQTNLDNAKTAVNALKSTDGLYEAKNYCAEFIANIQGRISKLSSDAAKAYKADGTGTAGTFNTNLNVAPVQASIDSIAGTTKPKVDGFPKQAVAQYDALQAAMKDYKTKLDAARDKVKGYAVYTDENYDKNYKTQLDLIQKRINDIKNAITAAQKKVGKAHWDDMLAINADAAILTDIETLLSSVQGDQNSYDAAAVADSLESLNKKITAFEAKGISKLGADVAAFQGAENEITATYNAVVAAKNAAKNEIDAKSEVINYTAKVDRTWGGIGTAGTWAAPHVTVETDPVTTDVAMPENYNGGSCQVTGVIISQTVNVENGIYEVQLYANANHANDVDNDHGITADATDVAYVFANDVEVPVVAKNSGSNPTNGEYTISNVVVKDGKLTIGIGKKKAGTNWHTIQIKSLKANTASVLQGWGEKVTKLIEDQAGLETFAGEIEAKVTANGNKKSGLATSIGSNTATPKTGLWKTIDDFKAQYKIGTDESTLGIRGKAGGAITTRVGELVDALTTLQGSNTAVDATAITTPDKTDKVSLKFKNKDGNVASEVGWAGPKVKTADNRENALAEYFENAANGFKGVVLSQEITGLANGIYDVELYANANCTLDKPTVTAGDKSVAHVYANKVTEGVPVNNANNINGGVNVAKLEKVFVTDGKLNIGMVVDKDGTNWHTIQIKSLTYHENDQTLVYDNTDEKALGLNNQYTKLAALMDSLANVAPDIKTKVENNAKANTAATTALTNLGTFEVSTLKNLKDVSNADGNFDTSNSDGNDINAKKADPANWAVFRSGLDADKNYAAKKKAIDDKIAELTAAITAANAAETLPYPWADEITVVTEDDPATTDVNEASSTTYKISEIKAAINALKTEAGTESANYWGYRNTSKTYFNVNIDASKYVANADVATLALGTGTLDKEFPQAATDLATIEKTEGAGAEPYYAGLINTYKAERRDIIIKMLASLNGRTAVADNSARVNELKALVNKVKAIKGNADANLKKYNEQKAAYTETQTLWNNTYTEIAATDHSSKVQDWLDELDVIQVTLTAATDAVEENYKVGKSVAEAKDFAAIKNAINDVKARQNASYSEFVAADNKAAHESFMGYEKDGKHVDGAIELATKAYQTAVEERAKYSSTNAAIKKAVDDAAAELDEALFGVLEKIQTLTEAENKKYAETESPAVFDVDDYNTQAGTIEQNITTALNTFKAAVKKAINDNVWSPKKTAYDNKVKAAKDAIKAYDADAKKDAFKDVEDLIAAGEKAMNEWTLAGVEAAIEGLEDIDNMLAADKDAAAAKDIDKRIKAADDKYAEIKADIEKKTIADDVNNVKATQLDNLEKAYDDKDDKTKTDVAYAKSLKKNFANRDEAAGILDEFLTIADNAQKAVDNAIAADKDNTKAYEEILAAIKPLEDKLTEAKAAIAPYKYATSSATLEGLVKQGKDAAKQYKEAGTAVAKKATLLGYIESHANDVEEYLTTAFGTEKTGLSADITELKNQYNAYVAANGLGETATAYKKDIDDLEAAVAAIAIEDLDKPTDGIQYDEIKAATAKLVKLQKDIADKETELLAANASTANADVLADFNTQIGALETTASLEGNDAWVGDQKVGDKKISDAIAEIQAQIADVKAAIQGEDNISFYKDQYQAKLDAIKTALTPVANAIATKQAQFTANADAFTTLSAAITTLQGKVDAAKAKVGAYEHNGDMYDNINLFEVYNDKKELTGGLQKTINDAKADLKTAKDNVSLTANSKLDDFGLNVATAEENVQSYLDESAYAEITYQRLDLNTKLTNAIDAKYKTDKYSNALWNRLVTEKAAINGDLRKLWFDNLNSHITWKITPSADYSTASYDLDEKQNWIPKACTSDADYATHMQTVAAIAQKIQELSDAVDNLSLLGDANEDKAVNVLDYQKVLNMILDPTAQPAGDSDLFQNVDINQNEVIEVGDLTAIVNYILTHEWNGYAAARAEKMEGESLTLTQGTNRIAVNLANVTDYTAFQMDLVLPEGMKLVGAQLSDRAGESHKLYSRAQLDGSIRMVASSVKGETFSGNDGAVLYLEVEGAGTPELLNILFSDANAVTRSFAIGNDATGIDTVSAFESLKQKVYDLGGRVKNGLKKGINIIRRADGTTGKVVK